MTAPPLLDLLERRASVREFTSAPVSEEVVDRVLSAGLRAPTSFNFQPYSIVVVRDPGTRQALSELVGNQAHVRQAPVLLAVCADLAGYVAGAASNRRRIRRRTSICWSAASPTPLSPACAPAWPPSPSAWARSWWAASATTLAGGRDPGAAARGARHLCPLSGTPGRAAVGEAPAASAALRSPRAL
ncbi:hypothetical protein GXW82_08795 [Streptacidiphilus sp. 4-A2]|nr:hypothetical protein [Streptacidiphilus sp. 4-A2]